jgi:hypothetical protein
MTDMDVAKAHSGRLRAIIESCRHSPGEMSERLGAVHELALRHSKHLATANFTAIHTQDLRRLFALYDEHFFEGQFQPALHGTPVYFRLSSRMTSVGGTTTRYRSFQGSQLHYAISISTTLLFQSFQDVSRPIEVSGRLCRDRLEALQRIFEHELIHLAEMVLWVESSCSAPRFQGIAHRLFGHTDHRHALITPRERAWRKFGLRAGDRVRFRFDGKEYVGFVNRINKRATVLVEDRRGVPYSDGKRYHKFYVPLDQLSPDPAQDT